MQIRLHSQVCPMAALLALGLLGCGETPGLESDGVSIEQLGDTTIVTTARPSSPDTARLTQIAEIGRLDGPEDFLLFGSFHFTVGWRGEVYVADSDGIRVFSPDGLNVRGLARIGEGPGEIEYVTGLAVDESGRLLAVDLGNRRVAVFDTSGVVLDHWRLPAGRPGYGHSAVIPIPSGQTLLSLNRSHKFSISSVGYPRPIYLRLDHGGSVLDTVFAPARFLEGCPTLDDPHFSAGWWQDLREPMYPKVKWTATRVGEVVYGCSAEYEADRLQPDGHVKRFIHEREPMTDSREVREAFVKGQEEKPGWDWKGPIPPAQKPAYHRIIPGRAGRLWVWPGYSRVLRRYVGPPVKEWWEDPRTGGFDVFDEDGVFLGVVPLPEGALFHTFPGDGGPFAAGDTVWLKRTDSLGVKYIDRMLIEW